MTYIFPRRKLNIPTIRYYPYKLTYFPIRGDKCTHTERQSNQSTNEMIAIKILPPAEGLSCFTFLRKVFSPKKQIFGLTKQVFCPRKQVFGLTNQVFGLTNQVLGPRKQVFGLTNQVFGLTNQVLGLTNQVHSPTLWLKGTQTPPNWNIPLLAAYIQYHTMWEDLSLFMGTDWLWKINLVYGWLVGKYRSWEVLHLIVGRFQHLYGML